MSLSKFNLNQIWQRLDDTEYVRRIIIFLLIFSDSDCNWQLILSTAILIDNPPVYLLHLTRNSMISHHAFIARACALNSRTIISSNFILSCLVALRVIYENEVNPTVNYTLTGLRREWKISKKKLTTLLYLFSNHRIVLSVISISAHCV